MSRSSEFPRLSHLQPRLPVQSLVASYEFYHRVLGFNTNDVEIDESGGFAIVRRDGVSLQLVKSGADHPQGQLTFWIQVADATAEYNRVRSCTAIEWGPEVYWYGAREFAVLDPDGHRIIFSTPTDELPTCTAEEP